MKYLTLFFITVTTSMFFSFCGSSDDSLSVVDASITSSSASSSTSSTHDGTIDTQSSISVSSSSLQSSSITTDTTTVEDSFSYSSSSAYSLSSHISVSSSLSSSSQSTDSLTFPRQGVYGMIADFEGQKMMGDVTETSYIYTFTNQQSTVNTITCDCYEHRFPHILTDVQDAPSGDNVFHIDVTLRGEEFPMAGFGIMFEHDDSVVYENQIDQEEFGGKVPYDYSDIKSISFYVKGSGMWAFVLNSLSHLGLESPDRYDQVEIPIPVSDQWNKIEIPRSMLIFQCWCNWHPSQEEVLSQLVSIRFMAKEPSSTGTDAYLYVDKVMFNGN